MQTEALRLDRLINDLLDVSRIQTGRLQIQLRPVDLRNHLAHVVSTVQLAIPDHPIVLDDLPSSPLWCNADAQRLEQVLINLLTNAAKYSYEGRSIRIGLRGMAEHIEVTVRDQGIGIPAADLPFIFDRFYQVQRPARESRPGMGLGLFITQEIVRQHGGTLTVESQEEIGSCFTVRLPYAIVMSEEVTSNATSTICPSA
jgi:signal transduction histidine kinase